MDEITESLSEETERAREKIHDLMLEIEEEEGRDALWVINLFAIYSAYYAYLVFPSLDEAKTYLIHTAEPVERLFLGDAGNQ